MTRTLVVMADGGSRGNPGPAGYGAVVFDGDTGEVLAERAGFIGVATNNVAEYRGVLAGVTAALGIDKSAHLDIRLDSKLIVEQMEGRWKIKHPDMKALAARLRDMLAGASVDFSWQPRADNSHADALANEAMDTRKPSIRRGHGADGPDDDGEDLGLF